MKNCIFLLLLFIGTASLSQRDMTPGKRRSDVFGKSDFKDYRFYGLQISGGPTYQFTRSNAKNAVYNMTGADGRPMDYSFDPSGMPGAYIEVGMAHFTKKRSKLSMALKTVLISYFDWGIGFKMLSGAEKTMINRYNATGSFISSETGKAIYNNGYLFGRFAIHKNIGLNKRYFIDNGLGVNFDYRIIEGNKKYEGASLPDDQSFHNPFVAQLHYDLGFGIRLSRRSILIPGAQVPIMGFQEWRKGCAALKWYSSNYLPVLFHIKWIYLFEKRVKGCNTPGTEEDKKRNMEYLQNN